MLVGYLEINAMGNLLSNNKNQVTGLTVGEAIDKAKILKSEMQAKANYMMYEMTKDGFTFLAMGFTGKEAAKWKEAYINAFNAMAEQLSSNTCQLEPPTITKAQEGVLFNKVKVISGGRGKIRAELWSRFQNHFNLSSYKYLPADQYENAIRYLEAKQKEYLGDVEMFYISSKEIEDRVKTLAGELVEKPKNAIVINIDASETDQMHRYFVCSVPGSTTIQKLNDGDLLRFATESLREKGYIILKKDTIISKLEA